MMVFDKYAADYDKWFDDHDDVYLAQLHMLRGAVPDCGHSLEVGIGSGRLAVQLGIRCGVNPPRELIRMAKDRGIEVVLSEGEHLPYRERSFDFVLMMTVICFLEGPHGVSRNVCRVLVSGGNLLVGFIEKDGEIATKYQREKTKGRFLRFARFRTADEVIRFYRDAGFSEISVIRRVRELCVVNGRKL